MQRGERMVYDAMAKLPPDWVIFHSCKEDYLEDGRYIHYEADFVLLIPRLGIVVIEVKDWPQVRIQHGRWQSRKNSTDFWKEHTHSPLEQANIALQKLMRSMTRCACLPQNQHRWPEHRHMVILTQGVPAESDAHNLPFHSLYLCGAGELKHLQQRIESLFILQQPERMSEHRVQKIADALAPSVIFHMELENYLQEMDAAAAHLLNLLPSLYESKGGIRVEGCAGSGKTVIACAEAARLAAAGTRRILVLCFNHALAHELQQNPLLREHPESITTSNFHDYCIHQILEPKGLGGIVNYGGPGDRLPGAAMEQLLNLVHEVEPYDAIFVDEAQDFRAVWWRIIQGLLAPQGKLFIFADKNQDLYDRYDQLPDLPTRIQLNTNLRNSLHIATFCRSMLPQNEQKHHILPMSGNRIIITQAADTPERRAQEVTRIITELKSAKHGAKTRDIVVLSPWRSSHPRCSLCHVPGLAIAPADEAPQQAASRRNACKQADAPLIFSSTVKSFKGQEAPYVIVTDVIGLSESRGFDMKELYTACSRARYGLYIVPSSTGKALIESFLSSEPCV